MLIIFLLCFLFSSSFFFHTPSTTEIYTLSLHDALPISDQRGRRIELRDDQPDGLLDLLHAVRGQFRQRVDVRFRDRKSTRLNSSHVSISYAVFCLKKKKKLTEELHKPDLYVT